MLAQLKMWHAHGGLHAGNQSDKPGNQQSWPIMVRPYMYA